ncbi:MAG: ZIP family metal transporter [Treponema sp.]|nr:ZIP family metal transporter [Treponema sp.]
MIQIIVFSAIAGICGMGLGGIISAVLLKRPSENMICRLLSFAAGVMISIVCFGLVPESFLLLQDFGILGIIILLFGLILGAIIIMGLNYLVDKINKLKDDDLKMHHTHEQLYHESQLINNPSRMLRSGLLMLIAIALHNVPEGIAIGAGGSFNFKLGALLAIMIAVHNIPEGMAIAAPLLAGGINKYKVIFLTSLAGATTLLGGFIGILIGGISNLAVALSLSLAGGAMLYIVFGEILPQSIIMTKNRTTSIVTLFGIIVGLIVTKIQGF